MLSAIFFLVAFLGCLTCFMMIPKTKDGSGISFLRILPVCFFIELSLGAIAAFVLNALGIWIGLASMGLVYLLIGVVAVIYLFSHKKEGLQKYHLEKLDIINYLSVFVIILFVIWRVFGFNLDFLYVNSDSGEHFSMAMKVVKKGTFARMHFAPLYNGLFIKTAISLFPKFPIYKAFILSDTLMNFLSGIMFYVLYTVVIKNRLLKILSPIVTVLYFVGWPVYNYVQGGFVYWGIGATLVMVGIFLILMYQKQQLDLKWLILLLAVIISGIAFCYLLFVPYVFVAFALVVIMLSWKNIKNKKRFIGIIASMLVVGIIISIMFVGYFFRWDVSKALYWLAFEGGIHRSLYKDMIYFVPFMGVAFVKMKQEKTCNVVTALSGSFIIMTLCSFVLFISGIMSSYYYYKLYYILWVLCWLCTAQGLEYELESKHRWIYGYGVMIAVMFIYSFTPIEDMELKRYDSRYEKNSPEFPMYSALGSFLKNKPEIWTYVTTEGFWDVVDFAAKSDTDIPLLGDEENDSWYSKISKCSRLKIKNETNIEKEFFQDMCKDTSRFAIEKHTEYYKENKDILEKQYDIIYEQPYAVVYQKK